VVGEGAHSLVVVDVRAWCGSDSGSVMVCQCCVVRAHLFPPSFLVFCSGVLWSFPGMGWSHGCGVIGVVVVMG
jgi:hypothetical protein